MSFKRRLTLAWLLLTAAMASPLFAATPEGVHVPTNTALKALSTVNTVSVVRDGFAAPGDAPPLQYVASNVACPLNGGNGDSGSQVKSVNNKCWLARFPNSGVDFRWFGADPTGVADSRPAINAAFALGSNRTYVCASGTYLIASTAASDYPLVAGPTGLKLAGTSGTHLSNIKIRGADCTITANNSHNDSNWFVIDYVDHLQVDGLTFQANKTGLVAASPSMMVLYHLRDFDIRNVRVTGDWGGQSTLLPAFVRGDWLINGKFDRIDLPQVGQCYDLAYIRGVSFTNSQYVGAGTAGGASAFPCISIAYDNGMQSNYPYSFSTTTDTTISGNDISNFGQGLLLRAGQRYQITGNTIHGNPGHASGFYANGSGILGYYESAACCSSATDPVISVTITGNNISDNGATAAGAGVYLDTHLSAGVAFSEFTIVGNDILNNASAGIQAAGSTNLSNVHTDGNGFAGASQTTAVGANILKVGHVPLAWTPVDASGAGLSFSNVSAEYALHDTNVTLSFTLQYPATANGSSAVLGGLPYLTANQLYGYTSALCFSSVNLGFPLLGRANQNTQGIAFYNGSTGANVTNAQLTGDLIQCALTYPGI